MHLIGKYFPSLTSKQIEQFSRLDSLYRFWNQRVNVISRKDIENLYVHHVLHSLSIAKIISFNPGTRIIDAGTGGGFPGIPLAILFPDVHFILVDSITKKMRVVETIIRELRLVNCKVRNLRMEAMHEQTDFVVSRAVTEIPRLYGWVEKNIDQGGTNALTNGLLALKGGDLTNELMPIDKEIQVFSLSDYFVEPFFETKKLVYIPR